MQENNLNREACTRARQLLDEGSEVRNRLLNLRNRVRPVFPPFDPVRL